MIAQTLIFCILIGWICFNLKKKIGGGEGKYFPFLVLFPSPLVHLSSLPRLSLSPLVHLSPLSRLSLLHLSLLSHFVDPLMITSPLCPLYLVSLTLVSVYLFTFLRRSCLSIVQYHFCQTAIPFTFSIVLYTTTCASWAYSTDTYFCHIFSSFLRRSCLSIAQYHICQTAISFSFSIVLCTTTCASWVYSK